MSFTRKNKEVMAMMTNETVRELCAEMKSQNECFACRAFADRILSAREREMAAKDAEIARLEEALKPVMNACDEDAKCDAVREAQRVMKESFNGESHN